MRWMLLVGALGCGAGCSDDSNELGDMPGQSTLRLLGVAALDASDCTSWPGGPMLASGVMDTLMTSRYMAALAVENTGGEDVALRTAEVTVSDTQGTLVQDFWADAGGLVPAGEAAMTYVPVIPSPRDLPSNVLVEVSLTGETSTRAVGSLALSFPIQLCAGCLIEYPAEADDPEQDGYQCAQPEETEIAVPCQFGQDAPIDCRLCSATIPECLAPY